MNALQQRMMAKAMAHGEMEGMGMGPVPASQRAVLVSYDGRQIPEIGYHVPGDLLVGKAHPNKKKMSPEAKAAWVASNPEQAALLDSAKIQRSIYAANRATGDFGQVAATKAILRQQKKEIRASPNYVPQQMSAALQKAHATRAHNTFMRDALGKAAADKYRRAADAAAKAGTTEVIVDGILLTNPGDQASVFAHRKLVLDAKARAKANKGTRVLSMKPAAVAARARTALVKDALARAGVVIPKAVRVVGQKKSNIVPVVAALLPREVPLPVEERKEEIQAVPATRQEREKLDARLRGTNQYRWKPYPGEQGFPNRTYKGELKAFDYASRKYLPIALKG